LPIRAGQKLKISVESIPVYISHVNHALKNIPGVTAQEKLIDVAFPIAYKSMIKHLEKSDRAMTIEYLKGRGYFTKNVEVSTQVESATLSELIAILKEHKSDSDILTDITDIATQIEQEGSVASEGSVGKCNSNTDPPVSVLEKKSDESVGVVEGDVELSAKVKYDSYRSDSPLFGVDSEGRPLASDGSRRGGPGKKRRRARRARRTHSGRGRAKRDQWGSRVKRVSDGEK